MSLSYYLFFSTPTSSFLSLHNDLETKLAEKGLISLQHLAFLNSEESPEICSLEFYCLYYLTEQIVTNWKTLNFPTVCFFISFRGGEMMREELHPILE